MIQAFGYLGATTFSIITFSLMLLGVAIITTLDIKMNNYILSRATPLFHIVKSRVVVMINVIILNVLAPV
jgi:hypothetical protein